ncbi:MAG: hypothetical protein M3017_09720 [Actinomycetota bacterium]|nr:hypothetical protein [Actinomycetota bacterium]
MASPVFSLFFTSALELRAAAAFFSAAVRSSAVKGRKLTWNSLKANRGARRRTLEWTLPETYPQSGGKINPYPDGAVPGSCPAPESGRTVEKLDCDFRHGGVGHKYLAEILVTDIYHNLRLHLKSVRYQACRSRVPWRW